MMSSPAAGVFPDGRSETANYCKILILRYLPPPPHTTKINPYMKSNEGYEDNLSNESPWRWCCRCRHSATGGREGTDAAVSVILAILTLFSDMSLPWIAKIQLFL